MAWGQPKRNGRCVRCESKGRCSCQRRDNAELAANPGAAPRTCTRVCRPGKGACNRTMHGGVCPCEWCP